MPRYTIDVTDAWVPYLEELFGPTKAEIESGIRGLVRARIGFLESDKVVADEETAKRDREVEFTERLEKRTRDLERELGD